MALEPTETREFEIQEIGELNKSPKGHTWIECETDAGTVVFWGGTSTNSLKDLQRRQPPFRVRCGVRHPLPNYPTHAWWVPDGAPIEFIDGRFYRVIASKRYSRAYRVYKRSSEVIARQIRQEKRLAPVEALRVRDA